MSLIEVRSYNKGRDADNIKYLLHRFQEEVEFGRPIHDSEKQIVESSVDSIIAKLESEKDGCVLASFNGNLVGFNMYHFYRNQASCNRCPGDVELTMLYVLHILRGKGIGFALDLAVIQRIKDKKKDGEKPKRIVTSIENIHHENIGLKLKLGFYKISGSYMALPNGRNFSDYARRI